MEVKMGDTAFIGNPPFQLPDIQSTEAAEVGGLVVVTCYIAVPSQGPTPVPVMTRMTGMAALAMAAQLGRAGAIAAAKSWSR
jgi:hypothetical protein